MLIREATLPDGRVRDVRIEGERIVAVEAGLDPSDTESVVEAAGQRLFPGAIDVHVHFREPGMAYKESWASGSASAAAGGVTTVVDQPNTDPPTVDGRGFDRKAALASTSYVDYGINGGVSPDWDPDALFDRPLFALGEVFLADSTGDMGIARSQFADAVAHATAADVPVTVHAEDERAFDDSVRDRDDAAAWSAYRPPEAELSAIETAIEVAEHSDVSLHIAHASTPEGVDAARRADLTCEVCPHHLFLSVDDLETLGTIGRMNPPLRDEARREGMWERLVAGEIDIVATDHAPHTAAEKDGSIWETASGVPGVETMLPLLLAAAERGDISHDRVAAVTARRPAAIFGLERKGRIAPGYDADLVLVDPERRREIDAADLHTAATWTPFAGMTGVFPSRTFVRGTVVFEDGTFNAPIGRNVREIERN